MCPCWGELEAAGCWWPRRAFCLPNALGAVPVPPPLLAAPSLGHDHVGRRRRRGWGPPSSSHSPNTPPLALFFSPSSLYNAVVPSCGPIERLNLCPPSPELPSPGPPSTPLGLIRLLLVRGISASVPSAVSWWPPSLPAQDPPSSLQPPPEAGGGQQQPSSPSSIFSLNLVEKLRRLGLDKVVARGELSYARGEHRGGRDAPT